MATINSRNVIDEIIAADGFYMDDPRVIRIVEYSTPEGATAYGVVWVGDRDPLRYERETFYVQQPKVIWKAGAS